MAIYYNGTHSITFYKGIYDRKGAPYFDNDFDMMAGVSRHTEGEIEPPVPEIDDTELDEDGIWSDGTVSEVSYNNTWADFHLVPSSRPFVIAPNPKVQLISLPRSNKILDLTNALSRDIPYEAREGDWEFIIDHDKYPNWVESFDKLAKYLNGEDVFIVLEDQPNVLYHGRVYADEYSVESNYSTIRIRYNLDVKSTIYHNEETIVETYGDGTEIGRFLSGNVFGDWLYSTTLATMAYSKIPCRIRVTYYNVNPDFDYQVFMHATGNISTSLPHVFFQIKEKEYKYVKDGIHNGYRLTGYIDVKTSHITPGTSSVVLRAAIKDQTNVGRFSQFYWQFNVVNVNTDVETIIY